MRVYVLGISLLEERNPEFIGLTAVVSEQKFPVGGRESVIDDHLNPPVETPQLEVEDS